jgi:type-F conjugative transfer system secretin TraK
VRVNIFFLSLLVAAPVFGLQKIQTQPDTPITASISVDGVNIIRVEQDRIESITAPNTIEAQHNTKTGEVALKPLVKKPIDLFLLTEKGERIQLRLLPTNIPAETIVLSGNSKELASWEQGQPYSKILADLVKTMYNHDRLEGYRLKTVKAKPKKFKGGSLKLIASYVGGKIKGDVYEFSNTSKENINLKELDFYQVGVRGITIVDNSLAPKDLTRVFVIRNKA